MSDVIEDEVRKIMNDGMMGRNEKRVRELLVRGYLYDEDRRKNYTYPENHFLIFQQVELGFCLNWQQIKDHIKNKFGLVYIDPDVAACATIPMNAITLCSYSSKMQNGNGLMNSVNLHFHDSFRHIEVTATIEKNAGSR